MEVKDLIVTGDARILGKLYFNQGIASTVSRDGASSYSTYRLTNPNTAESSEPIGGTAIVLKSDDSEAAIMASESNEISFGSNSDYIFFGYENRVGSSGLVKRYKFGAHNGPDECTKGIIECGEIIEDEVSLVNKYAKKNHEHEEFYTKAEIDAIIAVLREELKNN